jgi:DMSO/TMAO reductase YedYZ molybdopterin-dependent catalytic subunit
MMVIESAVALSIGGRGMGGPFISRGFLGRRRQEPDVAGRIPPGQHLTTDFPVLSAGPTPHTPLARWDFALTGEVDPPKRWSWEEFRALPSETFTVDIHCVTKWSKLDTTWEGVSIDTLLAGIETSADHVVAYCDGGYTTNLPLADVTDGKAWIAFAYGGEPLAAEHGGPARLLVPHLYFWKSAKWVRGLELVDDDRPGFWETLGYHNYGDPWQEQRYWGD